MTCSGLSIRLTLLIAFASGCRDAGQPVTGPSDGSQGSTSPLPATLVFSYVPIPLDAIEFVVPIGNLNPPDHTLPTDHAYLYHRLFHPSAPSYEVVAPAGGIVRETRRGNDDTIRVQTTSTLTYYLAHVLLDAGIVSGSTVTAGQRLGMTSSLSFGMDLGLVNDTLTLSFLSPTRYSGDTLHADSPLKYFGASLRTALYAKERGTGSQPDGRIDFDRAGTLAGNWFLDGLAGQSSTLFGSGPMQLAFARDVDDPSSVRISIGGTLGIAGAFSVEASAPDPATVTPAAGRVAYRLFFGSNGGASLGLLIVEMIDAQRLKAEAFPGAQASTAEFTSQARFYTR